MMIKILLLETMFWISAHTSILKGVQICDNIIIGTRSVVNKNCNTPYSIYAGVPAVLKKYGYTLNTPWNEIDKNIQEYLINGSGEVKI